MLVLFETPAGYSLFKVLDEGKVRESEDLFNDFETLEKAQKLVKLKAFSKFENTTEALKAATALVESKLDKGLKKFLEKHVKNEELAISDPKLAALIKEKLDLKCVSDSHILELQRALRQQITNLIEGLDKEAYKAMSLGLAHSLSRYKLKFSPEKVDTMIVQAISLLDDLDKELNTYSMRVREWYGWHFPELSKVVADHSQYCKIIKKMGFRSHAPTIDLSDVVPEDKEKEVKEAAIISMGTEISDDDLSNIQDLCDQVLDISAYRGQLYDYLENRMQAIAPNLSVMVGEMVGARLIAHAGSLITLAKQPASTIQILGAEKALFRALKTKSATPKYGLIYHASLIGQTSAKNKGKVSRALAAKTALAIRADALGEKTDTAIGLESRAKVEARVRQLEGREIHTLSSTPKHLATKDAKAHVAPSTPAATYNKAADVAVENGKPKKEKKEKKEKKDKKRKAEDSDDEVPAPIVEQFKAAPMIESEDEKPSKVKKEKKEKKDKKESKKRPAEEDSEVEAPKKEKKAKKAKKSE